MKEWRSWAMLAILALHCFAIGRVTAQDHQIELQARDIERQAVLQAALEELDAARRKADHLGSALDACTSELVRANRGSL